ncbi:MAG: MFS transporter, partial [Actinomycetota bacterium]
MGPLADRNFRLLAAGQLTSTIGDFCYAVALPWLVLSERGGPVLLGLVLACYGVPRTVLVPVGGILADKLGPGRLMLAADIGRGLLVVVLTVIAARHLVSLAALGPVAALLGAGEGLFLPASFAIMPTLLPPSQLQSGNAINSAAVQIGTVLGPTVGGILVATSGSVPAFAVDAASFGISAVALWQLRARPTDAQAGDAAPDVPPLDAPPGGSAAPDTFAAPDASPAPDVPPLPGPAPPSLWRLLTGSRFLQVLMLVCVMANFTLAGTLEVALPALAHARFGAEGYGALVACLGVGSVAGTLAAARRTGTVRPMIITAVAYVASGLIVGLVPFLGGLPGAAAGTLLFGLGIGYGDILVITLIQQWAPPAMLGRVMGLVMLASIGTFPASVAITGVLVHALGPAPFFPATGGVLVLALIIAMASREFRNF